MSSRFPAKVELTATTRHSSPASGRRGTVFRHRITAGTLEIRFDRVTITPLTAVAARQGEPSRSSASACPSIHATAPVRSKPRITTKSDAKKSSRSQSTRSIAYAGSRCATSTISAPAAIATSGSEPPASHPTTATPNIARPLVTSGRSSDTGEGGDGGEERKGSRSSAAYARRR